MMIAIIFLHLLSLLQAKSVYYSFSIRQLQKQHTLLLTKFGSTGETKYQIRAYFQNADPTYAKTEIPLIFDIFQHDDWYQIEQQAECQRSKLAKYNIHLKTMGDNESTQAMYDGTLSYGPGKHLWFLVLNNCQHSINSLIKVNNKNTKLIIQIKTLNSEGSEFSIEEIGYLQFMFIILLMTSGGFYYFLKMLRDDHRKNGELDIAFLILVIILGIEVFSNLCDFLHLWIYSYNGSGIYALELISEITSVVGNYVIVLLFILISWGWTVEFIDIEDYDLYIPLAFLIGFIQVLIVGLGKLIGNQYYYHCYDGWVGYVTVGIYFGMWIYFYYSAGQRKKKGVDSFYRQFRIYGSLFFLSFPIFLFISKVVDPYKSFKVIMIGTLATRIASIILLAILFMGKNSTYRAISYKGKSFLDRGKQF